MVSLGSDRWEVLCTKRVILNEDRWRRKWTWNRGTGDTILEALRGNYPHGNHITEGGNSKGCYRGRLGHHSRSCNHSCIGRVFLGSLSILLLLGYII